MVTFFIFSTIFKFGLFIATNLTQGWQKSLNHLGRLFIVRIIPNLASPDDLVSVSLGVILPNFKFVRKSQKTLRVSFLGRMVTVYCFSSLFDSTVLLSLLKQRILAFLIDALLILFLEGGEHAFLYPIFCCQAGTKCVLLCFERVKLFEDPAFQTYLDLFEYEFLSGDISILMFTIHKCFEPVMCAFI